MKKTSFNAQKVKRTHYNQWSADEIRAVNHYGAQDMSAYLIRVVLP